MPAAKNVNINVEGNFSGNIIIGDNNIVYGNQSGAIVNKVKQKFAFESRARPINLRPRAFPSLLSRTTEIANIKNAITNSMPITLFGENGIGKTSLLRYVSHLTETKNFNDGVIYLIANSEERGDLLQQIFDSFYTSNQNQKPTDAQLREDLKNIQALIILDDLTLKREDTAFLLDVVPNSTFIFASTERILWGEGQPVGLDGLPENEALQLFERELGRAIKDDEKESAVQICKILLYHPLRILQTASMIREDGLGIPQAFAMLTKTRTQSPVLEVALNKTNETQKKILSLLAVAGGFALTREHLQKLAGSLNFDADMKPLLAQGFVSADGASFSLSGEAIASLVRMWDLSGWEDALISHLSNWLQTAPQDMLVDQVASTLFYLIQRAGEKKQWKHVVTIGRKLEQIYALKKKWEGWLKILNLLRMAANALKDKFLEGYVFHQLGSRAMCMGSKVQASELLNQALNIRKAIGDKPGLQVTQHNLNMLANLPVPNGASSLKSTSIRRFMIMGGITGVVVITALIIVASVTFLPALLTPTEIVPPTEIPTDIPPPTETITLIPTIDLLTPKIEVTSINTVVPTFTPRPPIVLYDFVARADEAYNWRAAYWNELSVINDYKFFEKPSPDYESAEAIAEDYPEAYIGWFNFPPIEDNSKHELSLLVFTHPIYPYSYVEGYYDLSKITLQSGDRFEAEVGHVFPDSKDLPLPYDIEFQVFFSDGDNQILLGETTEYLDGKTTKFSFDIPKDLYGRRGIFILKVFSGSDANYSWGVWLRAQLIGFSIRR
ncbi:MAG: hypothetical protein JNJ43_16160 [Anaerolineales bacterium]|nr:hypothetical protein [Anaerolineales bacterium]